MEIIGTVTIKIDGLTQTADVTDERTLLLADGTEKKLDEAQYAQILEKISILTEGTSISVPSAEDLSQKLGVESDSNSGCKSRGRKRVVVRLLGTSLFLCICFLMLFEIYTLTGDIARLREVLDIKATEEVTVSEVAPSADTVLLVAKVLESDGSVHEIVLGYISIEEDISFYLETAG